MCLGNRAESASFWINKQYDALWRMSYECAEKHTMGIKGSKPEIVYGSSLAQLCVGKYRNNKQSPEDLSFYSSFFLPEFKFICNHDVLVVFKLLSGYFKEDGKSSIQNFEDFTCSFRVPFHQHIIRDTASSTQGPVDTCKAKFFVFDFEAATYVRELSGFSSGHAMSYDEVDRKQRAIVKYMTAEYLPLLRKAGHHYIHSLPDFDNLSRTHDIDFSLISNVKTETLSIFGINIGSINTFVTSRWLDAAGYIDELEEDHDYSLYGHFALAEHRGTCDDFLFHAYFGPPQIRLLCSKEVIFSVDIQDLHIYLDGGFRGDANHIFSNWKLDFIIDVQFIEEEDGNVRRLKVDFSKARFCEMSSVFGRGETIIEEAFFNKLHVALTSYFNHQYLSILDEFHHYYVYYSDIRVIEEEEEEEDFELAIDQFKERVTITETFGFDMITAVTQGSINHYLQSLWKASQLSRRCLSHWSYLEYFRALFNAPQIQLPANPSAETVILYLNIREGSMSLLDRSKKFIRGESHEFSAWRLAFEVKLKVREYTKHHPTSNAYYGRFESPSELIYNQLVLDFSSARFRQDLSRLPGLFDDSHYLLMRSKRQALIYSITHYYLPELKREGYHVLYTVPTWRARKTSEIRFAPSSFSFQFYSASPDLPELVSKGFGRQRDSGQRNLIVICGMFNRRQKPSFPLPGFSWRWGSSQDIFSGSFTLSRSAFLDGWLLPRLQSVNLRTTLIPDYDGFGEAGEWYFNLVPLGDYRWNKARSSEWKEVGVRAHGIEFEYRNKDSWTHEYLGDALNDRNGGYSVSCETVNTLTLPTATKHGVSEVELKGKVTLRLEFQGGKKSWSTQSVAQWSVKIIASHPYGEDLDFSSTSSFSLTDGSGFSGDYGIVNPAIKDAATLLKEQLVEVAILEQSIVDDLRTSFSGLWPLIFSGAHGYNVSNPVFNERGDVLFDLQSPLDANGQIINSGRSDIVLSATEYFTSRALPQGPENLVTNVIRSESEADGVTGPRQFADSAKEAWGLNEISLEDKAEDGKEQIQNGDLPKEFSAPNGILLEDKAEVDAKLIQDGDFSKEILAPNGILSDTAKLIQVENLPTDVLPLSEIQLKTAPQDSSEQIPTDDTPREALLLNGNHLSDKADDDAEPNQIEDLSTEILAPIEAFLENKLGDIAEQAEYLIDGLKSFADEIATPSIDTTANSDGSYIEEDPTLASSTEIDTPLKNSIYDRSILGDRAKIEGDGREDLPIAEEALALGEEDKASLKAQILNDEKKLNLIAGN